MTECAGIGQTRPAMASNWPISNFTFSTFGVKGIIGRVCMRCFVGDVRSCGGFVLVDEIFLE